MEEAEIRERSMIRSRFLLLNKQIMKGLFS